MAEEWDVTKYRYLYETEEMWRLKKGFMVKHKAHVGEDMLACWAQCLVNMEFLGCRYDGNLMEKIKGMADGLIEDRTKPNKEIYDRNFISAASAANDRVKGRMGSGGGQTGMAGGSGLRRHNQPVSFVRGTADYRSMDERERSHKRRGEPEEWKGEKRRSVEGGGWRRGGPPPPQHRSEGKTQDTVEGDASLSLAAIGVRRDGAACLPGLPPHQANNRRDVGGAETRKRLNVNCDEVMNRGPFSKVVLFESSEQDVPANIMERAATAAHIQPNFTYTNVNNSVSCRFTLGGIFLASGTGTSQKVAKDAACRLAIQRLKETSFTIKVKAPFVGGERQKVVERGGLEGAGGGGAANLDTPLEDANIGRKMMRMMGWSGGGLGKHQQGIQEPIRPTDRSVTRSGLGVSANSLSELRRKVSRTVEDYLATSTSHEDLVFSADFTKDERKVIHEVVRKYNLKSRSYGKNEELRQLVVFKRATPKEIVEQLIECGGETSKYSLVLPTAIPIRR